MKKIFLIALGIISVLSASAQVWVGGSIGAEHRKTEHDNGNTKQNGFSLGPTIGYDLNQRWSVALSVDYHHFAVDSKNETNGGNGNSTSNQLSVSPYLRYHFAECGDVRFFCQGGIAFTMDWWKNSNRINGETTFESNHRQQSLGIDFRPGISYLFNDRITLLATLGAIRWTTDWANGESYRKTEFYADIYDTFSIGFQINL